MWQKCSYFTHSRYKQWFYKTHTKHKIIHITKTKNITKNKQSDNNNFSSQQYFYSKLNKCNRIDSSIKPLKTGKRVRGTIFLLHLPLMTDIAITHWENHAILYFVAISYWLSQRVINYLVLQHFCFGIKSGKCSIVIVYTFLCSGNKIFFTLHDCCFSDELYYPCK